MKVKNFFIICAMCFVFVSMFAFLPQKSGEALSSDYLRIHIRANSNTQIDQEVKYKVKDEIVKVLTPLLCSVGSKEEAIKVVDENIDLITRTADCVLEENNFSYKSKAGIRSEFFPTRSYGELTLNSDVYDALIIELGNGTGDNWWCVVYPPMCFVPSEGDGEEVIYKSKILEVIKNFFNK